MPNPIDENEEKTESGSLADTTSGEETSSSIGRMTRSDIIRNPHTLFAASKIKDIQINSRRKQSQASKQTPPVGMTTSRLIQKKSHTLLSTKGILALGRHGVYPRVVSDKEKLEELMARSFLVSPEYKEIIFRAIFNLLVLERNQHLRQYVSPIFKCTALDLALKQNQTNRLDDEIHKLLSICNPSDKYQALVPKKKRTLDPTSQLESEEQPNNRPRLR